MFLLVDSSLLLLFKSKPSLRKKNQIYAAHRIKTLWKIKRIF